MSKPRKRQLTIKWPNDKAGEIDLDIRYSTEDSDAGSTSDIILDETIAALQNLKTTGKAKPVLVKMDNVKDSE